MSTNRSIENEYQRDLLIAFIKGKKLPLTVTITEGAKRSSKQNRLAMLWATEISQQKGDMTPEQVRAYCKLVIGVPILRAENEAFRERYDTVVKPLPYETKMAIMTEPLDFPVTRQMTTKQLTQYLDGIFQHFAEQGIVLSIPEDLKYQSEPKQAQEPAADEKTIKLNVIDYARKALTTAADQALPFNDRVKHLEAMTNNYREVFNKSSVKLEDLQIPINAVLNGKRTVEQARQYIAVDVLDCRITELIGKRN